MKEFYIIILLFFIISCKSTFKGAKRLEIQVKYDHNFYGDPIKWKKYKRKIEYRIFDKDTILVEVGSYGEPYGFVKSEFNPKDSTIEIRSGGGSNFKKLGHVEYFKYNEIGELIERTLSMCRDNKIHHLAYRDVFDHEIDSMKCMVYKEGGELQSSLNKKLELPSKLNDEIYNQKKSNIAYRIILTEKEEYIYDNKKRLVKIIHKDKYDNILGYTKYKYGEMKKNTVATKPKLH